MTRSDAQLSFLDTASTARPIARIAANTVPMSLEQVPSLEPVTAVLEIPGGWAAELGIEPGDTVVWQR